DGLQFHPIRERAPLNQLFDLRKIPSVLVLLRVAVVVGLSVFEVMLVLEELRLALLDPASKFQPQHGCELVRFRQLFGRFEVVTLPLELKELTSPAWANRFEADAPGGDRRERFAG